MFPGKRIHIPPRGQDKGNQQIDMSDAIRITIGPAPDLSLFPRVAGSNLEDLAKNSFSELAHSTSIDTSQIGKVQISLNNTPTGETKPRGAIVFYNKNGLESLFLGFDISGNVPKVQPQSYEILLEILERDKHIQSFEVTVLYGGLGFNKDGDPIFNRALYYTLESVIFYRRRLSVTREVLRDNAAEEAEVIRRESKFGYVSVELAKSYLHDALAEQYHSVIIHANRKNPIRGFSFINYPYHSTNFQGYFVPKDYLSVTRVLEGLMGIKISDSDFRLRT